MKLHQKLAALLLISAGTLSTQVNAHESSDVEHIVSNLVDSAMNSVSLEIDNQVQKITLTASNLMSFDGKNEKVGSVTITDLAKTKSQDNSKLDNGSDKENEKENTDD